MKTSDDKDPVVRLLDATCRAVCIQANKAIDAFIGKIKETLKKHIPVNAQGLL